MQIIQGYTNVLVQTSVAVSS